ncbi:MAG: hypothetical protein RL011_501 [Pseudomonadota bacterium]
MAQGRTLTGKIYLILVACGLLWSCDQNSQTTAFSGDGTAELIEAQTTMARPVPPAIIKRFQRGTVMGFYRHLLATTSDEPFYFAGQEVRGLRSKLIAAEPLFAKLSKRHKSWGDYAKASVNLNVAPGRHYIGAAYKKLVGDFASGGGRFRGLKVANATKSRSPDAASARSSKPTRRPTVFEQIGALSALAIVAKHTDGAKLGLVIDPIDDQSKCTGSENFSAISQLEFSHGSDASICSGSFVKGDQNHDYYLTAAHCAMPGYSGYRTKGANGQTVNASSCKKHSDFTPADMNKMTFQDSSKDIAVCYFPPGTAAGYMSMATGQYQTGSDVGFAGYGKSELKNSETQGTFRCGNNMIEDYSYHDGVMTFANFNGNPNETRSSVGQGDSGSACMVRDSNGKVLAAGVVSGNEGFADGSIRSTCNDLSTSSNQDFLKDAIPD